jgi:hypothetical protein
VTDLGRRGLNFGYAGVRSYVQCASSADAGPKMRIADEGCFRSSYFAVAARREGIEFAAAGLAAMGSRDRP